MSPAARARSLRGATALLRLALCHWLPRLAGALGTRAKSGPRLVDLGSPEDTPRHMLFTFGLKQPSVPHPIQNDSLWVIMYQNNMSLAPLGDFLYSQLAREMNGSAQPEILGQGTEWSGFSTKHHLAVQRMKEMNPRDLVVLSDFGDVVLNPPRSEGGQAMQNFKDTLLEMLSEAAPGSVVVSAEAQCCVAALSYHSPGGLVDSNSTRRHRACSSGAPNCLGTAAPGTQRWVDFMEDLAIFRGHRGTTYPYLNAGLMAGRVEDMMRMLEALQLESGEDDQAVMTDLLYSSPTSLTLDYDQRLFGNARWARPGGDGCVFDWDDKTETWRQQDTGTRPLFIHTSGHYFSCLRKMASRLGWESAATPAPDAARSAARQGGASAAAALLVGALLSRTLT